MELVATKLKMPHISVICPLLNGNAFACSFLVPMINNSKTLKVATNYMLHKLHEMQSGALTALAGVNAESKFEDLLASVGVTIVNFETCLLVSRVVLEVFGENVNRDHLYSPIESFWNFASKDSFCEKLFPNGLYAFLDKAEPLDPAFLSSPTSYQDLVGDVIEGSELGDLSSFDSSCSCGFAAFAPSVLSEFSCSCQWCRDLTVDGDVEMNPGPVTFQFLDEVPNIPGDYLVDYHGGYFRRGKAGDWRNCSGRNRRKFWSNSVLALSMILEEVPVKVSDSVSDTETVLRVFIQKWKHSKTKKIKTNVSDDLERSWVHKRPLRLLSPEELKEELDAVDSKIARLVAKRQRVVELLGDLKGEESVTIDQPSSDPAASF